MHYVVHQVLRPFLYRRLLQRFGTVRVVNALQRCDTRLLPSAESPAGFRVEPGNWGETYTVCCPFCRDSRYRLYIGHLWGYADDVFATRYWWMCKCFNEECVTSHERRLHLAGMLFQEAYFSRGPFGGDVLNRALYSTARREAVAPGPVTLLEHLQPDHPARVYLQQRDPPFDPVYISREYRVGYCPEARPEFAMATHRLIIPVFREGHFYGWQARMLRDSVSKRIPKYYTMPGMSTSGWLYNFDRARTQSHLVLCEGVTDAWRYGPEAVALFGKSLSAAHAELIVRYCSHLPVVVLFDGSAVEESRKAMERLRDRVHRVVRIQLDTTLDPGKVPTSALRRAVAEAAGQHGVFL